MLKLFFPTYQSAKSAASWGCFNCHAPLNPDKLQDDNHANGNGKYKITCDKCNMSTWFDLEIKEVTA